MSQPYGGYPQQWDCAACGQQAIPAASMECPRCHIPRPGSPAEQALVAAGRTARLYEGERALQAGIAEMAAQGWSIVSQSNFQPPAGAGRTLALGLLGRALFKPPKKYTVVFQRMR
ncbi:MAG TPA: hypothetical protein VMV29_07485 [Ktedonobacterales bacterium]|nr:hypothetical protein [Ktedonobacterales bacterium]